MSNTVSVITSFQHTPPAGGRFVCLRSPAISKLVCLELATDPHEEVPPELREALTQLAHDGANALPVWVTEGKPGTGPVFLVRGQVGSGEDSHAGYAWLSELERFHIAWGGAVAGAQDVVFMIEAPDHDKLDALLASGPWSQVKFTVEPLVRTKDRLTPASASAGGGVVIRPVRTTARLAVDVSLIRPSACASTARAVGSRAAASRSARK